MGAYDGYKYAKKKNLKGWKKGAAVVGGALLGSINPFKVVKAAKTGYKAYKASKYTKKAVSSAKKTKSVKKASTKAKSTVVTKKTVKKTTTAKSTKKTTQTVKKQTKQVKAACFTAGTKIHTKDGFKNIEAVKAGDYVWSENPETYEKALKKVKKIFVREKDSIIRLSINGEVIETTDEHPFYVDGKGWVKAAELKAGDEVRTADGSAAAVESLESITSDEPIKVYNFEVEDFHTYYVSEQKVLVHNMCGVTTKASSVKTSSTVHGNSKASNKIQHGYEIYEIDSGKIAKVGISGQPLNKNGTSPRANRQVNKFNKLEGEDVYAARIMEKNMPNRQEALNWEYEQSMKRYAEGEEMLKHKYPRPKEVLK